VERAPAEREITVLDLLRHTSGLTYGALPVPGVAPHPVKQAYVDAKVGDFDQTSEEFTARLARQPLLHQPGTHWEYGHSTDVVGRIVEVVSGLDLDRFVRERISAPLGLEDTQGYRIWVLPNWARRRVRKVSSHAARMRFPFMDSLEPSSLARLRARRRSRAMFCGP
jgi:CubicO group peptidase (beta-lactamase class C family)